MTANERQGEASARRFRQVLEALDAVVWLQVTDSGRVLYVNPLYEQVWGVPGESLVADPMSFLAAVHPEDRERVRAALTPLDGAGSEETYRLVPPKGPARWIRHRTIPVADAPGRVVTVATDVTDEVQRHRQFERQNERLEKFASVVSHDLQNPLNVAMGYLELAAADQQSEHLDRVSTALSRIDALLQDVLTLSRQGRVLGDPTQCDLASIAWRAWETSDTEEATLVLGFESGALRVSGDESRLCQLFENLFRNAIVHGDSTVAVRVESIPGGFAVEDDGPGIPPDERAAVLEPGYSTRQDGTGFGLPIVQEIAHAHDWSLTITDADSGGARFEFTDVTFA